MEITNNNDHDRVRGNSPEAANQEIDEERYALKVLRGDFDKLSATSAPEDIQKTISD